MDRCDNRNSLFCNICGVAYTLPEDDVDGNFPHVLLCGHIFCNACLRSLDLDNVIQCAECQVESTLPEGGVDGLQVDSRIIGLIYTAKMNKMKSSHSKYRRRSKTSPIKDGVKSEEEVKQEPPDVEKAEQDLDEALAQAAENMAQLEHVHQTLVAGLTMQAKREKARLAMEVDEATEKAIHVLRKRKGMLLDELTNMEARFPASRQELGRVEDRMRALETAMEKAKQVRQFPSLESYCNLDMVLETLQAPVDVQSFDMCCISMGSGLSCILQTSNLNQSLKTCLVINAGTRKLLSEEPALRPQQQGGPNRRGSWRSGPAPAEGRRSNRREPSASWQSDHEGSRTSGPSHSPGPRPRPGSTSPPPDHGAPDVIIEEITEEQVQDSSRGAGRGDFKALSPTGPELGSDRRNQRRKKSQMDIISVNQGKVFQWVLVTHVVNPSHFYVCHVAERKEIAVLSKKIHQYCSGDRGLYTPKDTLWTGSLVFVRWKEVMWDRAVVTEVGQASAEYVTVCPLRLLVRVKVFFVDYGFTKCITINRYPGLALLPRNTLELACSLFLPYQDNTHASVEETSDSFLRGVNEHLRRVDVAMEAEMNRWHHQAIKCSLRDIVPVDLTKGWSTEAQDEFYRAVGSSAVVMQVFGQDRETLLVDLKKAPMDRSLSDMPISLAEHLVFVEVAKFYSPVSWGSQTAQGGWKPLQYYPPVRPRINTELNAVVTYINNPSDFYIQLVDNMEFLLLTSKLQDCYNASLAGGCDDRFQLYCPVLEQACVARFDNKYWYRAQVIGHPGGMKVEVRYVDFGNTKILSVSDLRKIKDEFFALPSMGIQCCLSDVVPPGGEETWSDACTDRFISLADQKLVTAIATDMVPRSRPLPVRLFESSASAPGELSASMSEMLVAEELASLKKGVKPREAEAPPAVDAIVWDPPFPDLLGGADEARSSPGRSDQTGPAELEPLEPLEVEPHLQLPACLEDLKVRVTHVNSPGSFYVQLTANDPQLKRVSEQLRQEHVSTEPQDTAWEEDMFCAAFINGVWERGRVLAHVTSSNIAELVRCDFGNVVKLHVSNLRPLQPCLEGCLVLECSLSDIRPAGGRSTWTATACDFISYYLNGALAVMTVKELTNVRPVPVSLYCANQAGQNVSFADFLVGEGLALKERKPRVLAMPKLEEIVQEPQVSEFETQVGKTETQVGKTETQVCKIETQVSGFDEDGPDDKNYQLLSALTPPPTPPSTPLPPVLSFPSPFIPAPCPKPAPRTHAAAVKVKTLMYNPPELPHLGQVQVTISAIGEDGLIYAMTHHAERQFEQLRQRLQQHMKALPVQRPYSWRTVQGCAVMGTDLLWYRGQVLEVIGGQVKVRYVDTGLVENIPVVHVYPTLLCEDIPQLCVPCQLHAVIPVGRTWQWDAVTLLKELLLNRSVDMQVMELPLNPRDCVTMQISLEGMSVGRIMCHHQHATMDPSVSTQEEHIVTSPLLFLDDWDIDTKGMEDLRVPMLPAFSYPSLPEEGEVFRVRIKHLQTPNEVFLCPLEVADMEGETLEEALSRVTADIDALPLLTDFPPQGVCLAEYSDGKYYRAKLKDFASSDPVRLLVHHVDFGSDDTLPTSKLRQMPVELLRFPAKVLKVRVAGFRAPLLSQERDMLPYCPQWSMKAALDMIELLHGDITASVQAREPELTVFLYDDEGELVHLPLVACGLAEFD